MGDFFEFEADFVNALRCIPMLVRYKLDTCGIKLKLSDWNQMTLSERAILVELPCSTAAEIKFYQEYLQKFILDHTGIPATRLPIDPIPPWMDVTTVPPTILEKAQAIGLTITLHQWLGLTPLQRFALIKLSLSGHENKNFPRALTEFNLI
ncbi:nitrate reductase associated protein [Anabaena cylindrica FACHB-243]|uniref:nitrate reductase associated protein n=1 Tax=Anabaena TaxID=1163 RepID=UPI0005AA065E|nr:MULTISPECIES: nitrate reductase associated protein [Anabaena]MBD2418360.1 nitrate reductase associated protein [Anabaena cylindrica FACHB-243]MBY5281174.1 nitrate reductase maturation protein NarM [Anabaena sp. CCAP 1446/1C]MBY5308713.1 nitrate reductase maturation protein NarM [Anabaena sp. CCAP 1446/1C]MCM2410276.1 nitrate reductase associated protein [Anabaena sp. CCAP 1446/1C]